jgi:hypothetical protein
LKGAHDCAIFLSENYVPLDLDRKLAKSFGFFERCAFRGNQTPHDVAVLNSVRNGTLYEASIEFAFRLNEKDKHEPAAYLLSIYGLLIV